ncbi:hypothetical protein CYLTODRAFT_447530 [Cylindrobasidium torrendii FP15055 ss-10]|uniref:Retrotransposon gag domain-containing protein n=1 Tax=Cylindrobasidium torrendii FP15055 ss-10 TaxID=1314674 RepID=A0A0D7ATW1_9AGAR|nr:hypothetical protein CYLTODRAFT_447530 [Cylindrobasidium torrendii FP15055 ss-10]
MANVRSVERRQEHWTFGQVIMAMFDRFVKETTLDSTREAYNTVRYSDKKGVAGYYDELTEKARQLMTYPSNQQIAEKFFQGLPKAMSSWLGSEGFTPYDKNIDEIAELAGLAVTSAEFQLLFPLHQFPYPVIDSSLHSL